VCGRYLVSGTALDDGMLRGRSLTKVMRATLSHRLQLGQSQSRKPRLLTSYDLSEEALSNLRLPSPGQQATNAIRFVGDYVTEQLKPLRALSPEFHSTIGAPNRAAAEKLVRELNTRGAITGIPVGTMKNPDQLIDLDLSLSG
jgi:hypothetical protein